MNKISLQQVWKTNITTQEIINNVIKKVKPGSIILLHDGDTTKTEVNRSATVNALPKLITELFNLGYQITLPNI